MSVVCAAGKRLSDLVHQNIKGIRLLDVAVCGTRIAVACEAKGLKVFGITRQEFSFD